MKNLKFLLVTALMIACLSACKDNDPTSEKARYDALFELDGRALTQEDGVIFKIKSNETTKEIPIATGQSVVISDISRNKATVTLKTGVMDLSDIANNPVTASIPVPNIFGTMEEVTVPVTVTLSGTVIRLDGASDTKQGKYNLSMSLDMSDRLCIEESTGYTNNTQPIFGNADLWMSINPIASESDLSYSASPFIIEGGIADNMIGDSKVSDLINTILNTPCIDTNDYLETIANTNFQGDSNSLEITSGLGDNPGYASVSQILRILTTGFKSDGNSTLYPLNVYLESSGNDTESNSSSYIRRYFMASPFRYTAESRNSIAISVNPGFVFNQKIPYKSTIAAHTGSIDYRISFTKPSYNRIISNILTSMSSWLMSGLKFNLSNNSANGVQYMEIYLSDTKASASMIKSLINEVAGNTKARARLIKTIKNDPNRMTFASDIDKALTELPVLIDNAGDLKFGFRYSNAYQDGSSLLTEYWNNLYQQTK